MSTNIATLSGTGSASATREQVMESLSPLRDSVFSLLQTFKESKLISSGQTAFPPSRSGGSSISCDEQTGSISIATSQGGDLEISSLGHGVAKLIFKDTSAPDGPKNYAFKISCFANVEGTEVKLSRDNSFGLTHDGFTFRHVPTEGQLSAIREAVAELADVLQVGSALAGNLRYADVEINSDQYAKQVAKRAALSLISAIDSAVDCYESENSALGYSSRHSFPFEVTVEKFSIEMVNGEPFGWVQCRQVQAGGASSFDKSSRVAVIKNGTVTFLEEKGVNCGNVFGADKGAFTYTADTPSGKVRKVVTIDGSGSTFSSWEGVARGEGVTLGVATVGSGTQFVLGEKTFQELDGRAYRDPKHFVATSLNREDPASSILLSAVRDTSFERIPFVLGKWVDELSVTVGSSKQTWAIADTFKLLKEEAGSWSGVVRVVNPETGGDPRTVPVVNGTPIVKFRGLDVVDVLKPDTVACENGLLTGELVVFNSTLQQHQVISLVKGAVMGAPRAFEAGVEPGKSREELLKRITTLEEQVIKIQPQPQPGAVEKTDRLAHYGL